MRSEPLSVIQRAAPPHTVEFLGVGEREFGGIINTPTKDRMGDVVDHRAAVTRSSWNTARYSGSTTPTWRLRHQPSSTFGPIVSACLDCSRSGA